jgi:hypothetical protein
MQFFPSFAVFQSSMIDAARLITLKDSSNFNLSKFVSTHCEILALIKVEDHTDLINAFFVQMAMHPNHIVVLHFNKMCLAYYMSPSLDKHLSFQDLLEDANHVHSVITNDSLPFLAASSQGHKQEMQIAAMKLTIQENMKANKDMAGYIGHLKDKLNDIKQSLKSKVDPCKLLPAHGYKRPPFDKEVPMDLTIVKKWNNAEWCYCSICKFWSTLHTTEGIPLLNIPPHCGGNAAGKFQEQSFS